MLKIPDSGSPTFEDDCIGLASHARAETRRHAAEAAALARQAAEFACLAAHHAQMAHEVGELADQLTAVVLS